MQIYHYNKQTGLYLGKSKAQKDPLEEDKYLVPANATDLEPNSEIKDGEAYRFIGGEWIAQKYYCDVCPCLYDPNNGYAEVRVKGFNDNVNLVGELPEDLQKAKDEIKARKAKIAKRAELVDFLNNSDWQILRHKDELELGEDTSLSEEQYRQLLIDRNEARLETNVIDTELED